MNDYHKEYRLKNKEKIKLKNKEYYKNNKHNFRKYSLKYRKSLKNKLTRKIFYKKYLSNDRNNLIHNYRRQLRRYIYSNSFRKTSKIYKIIGCSPKFLRFHIEQNFFDSMSWNNYGLKGWTFEHKIPLKNVKNFNDLLKLGHWYNIKPMWNEYNNKKGSINM